MNSIHTTYFIVSLFLATTASAAIFGVDNRSDLKPSSPRYAQARATAISVLSSNFSVNPNGTINIDVDAQEGICADEPFAKQPSLSYACTAFLVAPDLLVTAGHCVYAINTEGQELKNETERACKSFLWLFDYQMRSDGGIQVNNLPSENLFRCKQIIYAVENDKAPFLDYALIQLDRPAIGRTPLTLATKDVVLGEKVSLIGYPYGTPVKLTDFGSVTLTNPQRNAFVTSLDAFQGNSGGPVFNSFNEVVGILIGGTPSMNTYTDTAKGCERFNRCNENGANCKAPDKETSIFPGFQIIGSDVQRIGPIRKLLIESKN